MHNKKGLLPGFGRDEVTMPFDRHFLNLATGHDAVAVVTERIDPLLGGDELPQLAGEREADVALKLFERGLPAFGLGWKTGQGAMSQEIAPLNAA